MLTIETNATVSEEGVLTVLVPPGVPPGEHKVVLVIEESPSTPKELPEIQFSEFDVGPWPEGLSLRREDMYGEWGR